MKKIYYNGTVLTMDAPLYAEAVLTEDKIIQKTGSWKELRKIAPEAEPVDLHGNTLMPGFIDAHSHFSQVANSFLQVSLEKTKNWEEIGQRICEEARILYVALTRAIRNCIWMKDTDKRSNMSWSKFLEV